MTEHPTPFIFDLHGMLGWSTASGNESASILKDVQAGKVLVFNRVWKEFRAVFPDECKALEALEFERERVVEEHRLATAALAENANATFGRKGPYDQCIEWCVAGIASCGPYTIVTDAKRVKQYGKIDGLHVVTYEEFLNLQ